MSKQTRELVVGAVITAMVVALAVAASSRRSAQTAEVATAISQQETATELTPDQRAAFLRQMAAWDMEENGEVASSLGSRDTRVTGELDPTSADVLKPHDDWLYVELLVARYGG